VGHIVKTCEIDFNDVKEVNSELLYNKKLDVTIRNWSVKGSKGR